MIYLFLFIIQIGCYELILVSLRKRKLPVGRDKRAKSFTVQKHSNVHVSDVIRVHSLLSVTWINEV